MDKISLNFDHCFGITKLSQELTFEGENVVLIYSEFFKLIYPKAVNI